MPISDKEEDLILKFLDDNLEESEKLNFNKMLTESAEFKQVPRVPDGGRRQGQVDRGTVAL